MKFVPCITWIKRGVAKEMPEKVRLTKEELKELIEADAEGLLDEDGPEDEDEDDKQVMESEVIEVKCEKDEKDALGQYNLDTYDEDEAPTSSASGLKGLMCFSSNEGDPYMTVSDEEDESDIEDIQIKPDDNLIAFGVVDEDCNNVEFHVYNENENQFFAHHDILLPTMPLCMEWLNYEADVPTPGNYLAVGGMSPAIEVWDVDVVDCLEPAFVLGSSKKKKNKPATGHTDAVLDLAWNSNVRHVLASGSADFTVALWDMSKGKVVTKLNHCTEKVQSLKWHPFEPQHLLVGSCDELMTLVDCRDPDKIAKTWKCDGEVEKVLWNHFNPFYCLASTEKGYVHCVDARADAILWTLSAHPASCTGLCLSSQCPGFMVTAALDERIKVWDILDNKPSFIHEIKFKLGKLYSLAASPDSPFLVCAGGDNKINNYKLINLLSYAAVQNRFKDRGLVVPKVPERESEVVEEEQRAEETQSEHSVMAIEALNLSESNSPSTSKSEKKKKKKKKFA